MVLSLLTLAHDERHCILSWLSVSALSACEATCSMLRAAIVGDDALWRALGCQFWPSGLAVGHRTPSCRACFLTANGWAHIRHWTRSVIVEPSSQGGRRRSLTGRQALSEIAAFDATDDTLAIATHGSAGPAIELRREGGCVEWHAAMDVHVPGGSAPSLHDVRLLSGDRQRVIALGQDLGSGLASISLLDNHGAPRRAWQSDLTRPGPHGRFELACPPWLSGQALLRTIDGVSLVDYEAGRTVSMWSGADGPGEGWVARSMCTDPQEPNCATVAWRGAQRSLLCLFDLREGCEPVGMVDTRHANVCRVGAGPPGSCFTSHARCKDVDCWDRRTFSTATGASAFHSRATERASPCERARCAGNAPDFDYGESVLVAVSGGAAGTTLGAKLHVFSSRPRPLIAEAALPEIVIDETGHRLACPRGVRRSPRSVCFLASASRVLRCADDAGV